jgi:hypothetical protein
MKSRSARWFLSFAIAPPTTLPFSASLSAIRTSLTNIVLVNSKRATTPRAGNRVAHPEDLRYFPLTAGIVSAFHIVFLMRRLSHHEQAACDREQGGYSGAVS